MDMNEQQHVDFNPIQSNQQATKLADEPIMDTNETPPSNQTTARATGCSLLLSLDTQTTGCLSMKTIKGCNDLEADNIISKPEEEEAATMIKLTDQSLVDRLIDSELDWRSLVREANGADSGLNGLSEVQIKRQEVIHELVQTERHHCLTLALMRQVYLAGLRQLNETRTSSSSNNNNNKQQTSTIDNISNGDLIDLERLFPALEDLIQAHELFFAHLRLRLLDSCSGNNKFLGFVGRLGDLLCDQFRLSPARLQLAAGSNSFNERISAQDDEEDNDNDDEEESTSNITGNNNIKRPLRARATSSSATTKTTISNGQKLLQAYSKFCGSHYDSSRYYKQLMQNDKGFKQFIENCNKQNAACRQRGIPECNLLVTQRLTKYPLLIEQLIKTSKDDPEEERKLIEALRECKSLLAELNQQLARKESFERLLDIYAQFCPKSYTIYNKHLRFTKHDLLQHKRLRQLIHSDGQVRIWSATRRKLFQVLCLILNDIIVFIRFETSVSSSSNADSATAALDASALALDQSLCLIPLSSSVNHYNHSAINVYSASNQQPNQSNQQHLPQQQPTQAQPQQPQQPPFRYYFANIDNKSSVISLSKLLIREKAAHDTEPHTYLISSDPRQPEMYELAFISKRHQSGFIDKLKGCIEQHNRNVASMDEIEFGLEDDDDDDDDGEDDDDLLIYEPESMDFLDTEADFADNRCPCCAVAPMGAFRSTGNDEALDADADEDPDLDLDNDEVGGDCCCKDHSRALINATGRGSPSRANCRRNKSLRQKKLKQHLGSNNIRNRNMRRDTMDYFELDIEQDVVLPQTDSASSSLDDGPLSFVYPGSESRKSIENSEETNSSCCANSTSDADEGCCRLLDSNQDSGLSERAKDSLDEAAPSKQKSRGNNRRRRAQRPRNISNQSSSSSEAAHRQAIELVSASKLINSSAAIDLDGADEGDLDGFDSGRGHDESSSSSAASTSSRSIIVARSRQEAGQGEGEGKCPEEVQPSSSSPLRQDQSDLNRNPVGQLAIRTSNGSSSSNSSKLIDLKSLKAGFSSITSSLISSSVQAGSGCPQAAPTNQQQQQQQLMSNRRAPTNQSNSLSSSSASSSCDSSMTIGTNERPEASTKELPAKVVSSDVHQSASAKPVVAAASPAKSSSMKCSSMMMMMNKPVGGSCCSSVGSIKQRKLSNVSSMSNQLKLLTRLKCGFDQSTAAAAAAHCQCRQSSNINKHHTITAAKASRACLNHCDTDSLRQTCTLSKQLRQQMRRSSFVPEQKLEELRDLRIQLDKDKQEWQTKFNRMQEQLLNERRELDLAREKLKQDRQQVANEREQLYRKLDILKEKGILLSPSHKVIITAPSDSSSSSSPSSSCYLPTSNTGARVQTGSGNSQGANCYIQAQAQHQRQPLQVISGDAIPIRIHQHQQYLQTSVHNPLMSKQDYLQQQSTTNMFIQSSRVPLHLSVNGNTNSNTSDSTKATIINHKQTISQSKVTPLISALGSNLFGVNERLMGSSIETKNQNSRLHPHLESHVI